MDHPGSFCITSDSYEDTIDIAAKFACIMKPGDIVCLDGDLGAGKTAFTSGLASALGMPGKVSSPTFTILHEYIPDNESDEPIRRINHFDVYRLNSSDEFVELGFEEVIDQDNAVSVIEWADRISDILNDYLYRCIFVRIVRNADKIEGKDDPIRSLIIRLPDDDPRIDLLGALIK